MAATDIPQRVKAFITDHIDSVVKLEILLLLHRNFTKEYAAEDVAHELRIEPSWVALCLEGLRAKGILELSADPRSKYRFGPTSPGLRETIDLLAKAYLSHRVSITALIFMKPSEALRNFADAFRLRRDRTDG